MSYFDAVAAGFRNYFDFEGRATRPEFWWFVLFLFLLGLGTAVADMSFGLASPDGMMAGPINTIGSLVTFIPSLSIGARRLHDVGRSGWWQLIALTGIGIFVLIYWWCQPPVASQGM
jgi:uncharacterized membrane protein YhaH (DUF805 family)